MFGTHGVARGDRQRWSRSSRWSRRRRRWATAAGPREVRVSGAAARRRPTRRCRRWSATSTARGRRTEFDFIYDDQTGSVVGWGTERFDGCLDRRRDGRCGNADPAGALTFRFVYWALVDPATGALIEGRCTHPVTGGEGAFAHASGVMHMRDTPQADGSVRTTYRGRLVLREPAAQRTARASARRRRRPAVRPGASCGPTTVVSG